MVTHMKRYLIMDIDRLFRQNNLYWGILGVVISLFLSLDNVGLQSSVFQTFMQTRVLSGHVLIYVFCVLPYADSILRDLEYKYINYQIYRGNLNSYLASKMSFIFLSSVFTLVLGTFVFCIILRCVLPWGDVTDSFYDIASSGCYGYLISHGEYLLYCLFYSVSIGLLAGFLSIFSAFISLIVPNKIIVYATPVLLLQILYDIADNSIFTVFTFEAYNKIFLMDINCFLFNFAMSIIPSAVLFLPMKYILAKKI